MPIGKYEEDGVLKGISLLDIITQVKAQPEGTQILEVHIASPGGFVEDGDNIFNYLESLKKNFVVNTFQDGDIASIATKLFLVGTSRTADTRFKFMIHNPWNDPGPGDSNHQADNLENLLMEEDKLRKFYSKELDITEEGLKPLMDQETTLTAKQLLSLGFATAVKSNIKVMAMKKGNEPSLLQRAQALLKSIKGEGVKALDLQLADGTGVLSVDAPNEDSLQGANATLNGQPAPDGDYAIAPGEDGMSDVVTVAGGKVTAVVEQPAAIQTPQAKKSEDRLTALESTMATIASSLEALLTANKASSEKAVELAVAESDKKAEARIVALKNEIGTTHEPKRQATVYADSVDKNQGGHRSIGQVMAEKTEARKNKLNKN